MSTEVATAHEHVREFTTAYKKMGGLDPENVYSVAREGKHLSLRVSDLEAITLSEREQDLVERFRMLHDQAPRNGFMLITLPPEAMLGDEQREAIQQAVEALFAALAAVAR